MGKKTEPKIICLDLETLPNLPEALKVWPQLSNYPGLTLRASITSIICFGYREFGVDQTAKCVNAWDFKTWNKDVNNDHELVKAARAILEDADAIITHNGKRFDLKFFNTRLLINGLEPLHKLKHTDTCAIAKANLFLFNNRLNTLGEFLVGDQKMEHEGWDLWVKVHKREQASMDKMTRYCKKDVNLTTDIFKVLRPYCKDIPNYNLFTDLGINICAKCGSTRIKEDGHSYSQTTVRKRYRCKDCFSPMSVLLNGKKPVAA